MPVHRSDAWVRTRRALGNSRRRRKNGRKFPNFFWRAASAREISAALVPRMRYFFLLPDFPARVLCSFCTCTVMGFHRRFCRPRVRFRRSGRSSASSPLPLPSALTPPGRKGDVGSSTSMILYFFLSFDIVSNVAALANRNPSTGTPPRLDQRPPAGPPYQVGAQARAALQPLQGKRAPATAPAAPRSRQPSQKPNKPNKGR
jgi:hypothetical protein